MVGSPSVCRKFRQSEVPTPVGSPDVSGLSHQARLAVGSPDASRKSRLLKVLVATGSSDSGRASPTVCMCEQCFYLELKVPAICVETSDTDLNG
jgi:hypothetical protein